MIWCYCTICRSFILKRIVNNLVFMIITWATAFKKIKWWRQKSRRARNNSRIFHIIWFLKDNTINVLYSQTISDRKSIQGWSITNYTIIFVIRTYKYFIMNPEDIYNNLLSRFTKKAKEIPCLLYHSFIPEWLFCQVSVNAEGLDCEFSTQFHTIF